MSSISKQINSVELMSNPTSNQYSQSITADAPISFFKRAVVVDVIFDLTLLTPEEIDRLAGKIESINVSKDITSKGTASKISSINTAGPTVVSETTSQNGERQTTQISTDDEGKQQDSKSDEKKKGNVAFRDLLDTIPRNTIIARVVSMAEGATSSTDIICYPFFPPHICMPVKPGEHVWVMFESPDIMSKIGFWFSRISVPDFVDDINFTHSDRKFQVPLEKKPSDKIASITSTESIDNTPGFDNVELMPVVDAYETIQKESIAAKHFTPEAVPRFTKLPGDLVLQGSNNTLISLGQDRGWSTRLPPSTFKNSNAGSMYLPRGSGAIDIVAGRGRYPSFTVDVNDTSPQIIQNKRNYFETNKNPAASDNSLESSNKKKNKNYHPVEGDPDFANDASRLYVAMKSSGDFIFNTSENTPAFMKEKHDVKDVNNSPFVVVKSNEIRIISRYSPKTSRHDEEKGSIRIIREDADGKKICSLVMTHDGKILIDAEKIVIGDGRSNQISLGQGASESAVLGDTLEKLLENFCLTASTATDSNGAPIPAINSACSTLLSDLRSIKSNVTKVK